MIGFLKKSSKEIILFVYIYIYIYIFNAVMWLIKFFVYLETHIYIYTRERKS